MSEPIFKGVAVENQPESAFKGVAFGTQDEKNIFEGVAFEYVEYVSTGFSQIIKRKKK